MTSFSSNDSQEAIMFKTYDASKRKHVSNMKNYNYMRNYYKPALISQNTENEMPLFLSAQNLDNLVHLFKSMGFKNKYQSSMNKAKQFKRTKFINQQKTQTQDKLGELTTRIEAVDYLKKEPRHLNANIPANFWFKDADQFIQTKKSL